MKKTNIAKKNKSLYQVSMELLLYFFKEKGVTCTYLGKDFIECKKGNKCTKVPKREKIEEDKLSKIEIIKILKDLDLSIIEFEDMISKK